MKLAIKVLIFLTKLVVVFGGIFGSLAVLCLWQVILANPKDGYGSALALSAMAFYINGFILLGILYPRRDLDLQTFAGWIATVTLPVTAINLVFALTNGLPAHFGLMGATALVSLIIISIFSPFKKQVYTSKCWW